MDKDHLHFLWTALAAMAGSVTGLAFMPWKSMSWVERLFVVSVGFGFATFMVPWFVVDWIGKDIDTLRAACGASYIGGTLANSILPIILKRSSGLLNRWMDRVFGKEDAA